MKKIVLLLSLLNIFSVFGSSIDTVVVTSKSMNKDISNIIIKPAGYSSKSNNYPVYIYFMALEVITQVGHLVNLVFKNMLMIIIF